MNALLLPHCLALNARPEAIDWRTAPNVPVDRGQPDRRAPSVVSPSAREKTVYAAFLDAVRRHAERIALDDGNTRLTYAEAAARISALAGEVAERVTTAGPIGILVENGIGLPIAMMACLAVGRTFVALDLHYPRQHNSDVLREAGLAAVVVDRGRDELPELPGDAARVDMRQLRGGPAQADCQAGLRATLDDPAVILYTSGSTGRPKGVVNSQRAILERVWHYVEACRIDETDVLMPLSSPCTIAGLRETFTALLTGARLRLLDPKRAALRETSRAFRESRVSVCYVVPTLLRALIEANPDRSAFAAMRIVRIGGERILWADVELLRRAMPERCGIYVGYSSTETTGTGWLLPRDMDDDGRSASVPVGYMLPGTQYVVLGADPKSDVKVGELVVESPYVALGHWQGERCVPGPVREHPVDPTRRIIHTGDIVSVSLSGLVTVLGRADRQVKIRGQRVEPGELEAGLRRLPSVADAAVLAPVGESGAELVAFVVLHSGDLASVRTAIREALPAPLHPARLHQVAELPRLPGGKLNPGNLMEIDQIPEIGDCGSGVVETSPVPDSQHELGARMARLWRDLLSLTTAENVAWDAAGGNSLQLLRLVFELEERLKHDLPQGLFTPDMTIGAMTEALRLTIAGSGGDQEIGGRARLFLFPGVGGDEALLAPLKSKLSSRFFVTTVAYRGWSVISDRNFAFHDGIEEVARQICALTDEPVHLAGYSYGGIFAFGVARRLRQMGREIASMGLLDSDVASPSVVRGTGVTGVLARVRGSLWRVAKGSIYDDFCRTAAHYLMARPARRLSLLLLDSRFSPLSSRTRFSINYWLCRMRRSDLARKWLREVSETEDLPIVLFRSEDETMAALPSDLGWSKLNRNLEIVPVPGDHATMLAPERLHYISERLHSLSCAAHVSSASRGCATSCTSQWAEAGARHHPRRAGSTRRKPALPSEAQSQREASDTPVRFPASARP